MKYLKISHIDSIATITLNRGKVNALNEPMVEELASAFTSLETDPAVQAVIITGGQSKFFSFGFDIPEFLHYSQADFTSYLHKFTSLYAQIFLFSKPVIAALNGHTMAGGAMLAAACDSRIMIDTRAKIALNEITFGATVLAGATEMLVQAVGNKNAQDILYTGQMYSPEAAQQIGLVDSIASAATLQQDAQAKAESMSQSPAAFRSIKSLLRGPTAARIAQRETQSIQAFVKIWYSPSTQAQLAKITIQA